MNLEKVKEELGFNPRPEERLFILESGVRNLQKGLNFLITRKNRVIGPRFTKDAELRLAIMERGYEFFREFSDPEGVRVLIAAREWQGHPARGRRDISWHPYKLGLHLLFLNSNGTSKLTARLRQIWGDTMLLAHQYNVPAERLREFLQFGRGKLISYNEVLTAIEDECCGWDGGCEGCGEFSCVELEKVWGARQKFPRP